jgi:SPP1 family predicted phage head-tail adaptor
VRIETRLESDDGGGGKMIAWVPFATVWANVSPGSGREFEIAKQERPTLSHQITIRYRPSVTPKQRLVAQDRNGRRAFDILTVVNTDELNDQLVLYCSETVQT